MTPKEKAKELVDSFMSYKPTKMSDYSRIEFPTAKAFALISVDEIIKTQTHPSDYVYKTVVGNRITELGRFYQDVKKEINKL